MRKIYVWAVALLMSLMAGCNSLGVVQPKSFEERYAIALAVNASVRTATAQAVVSKAISKEVGQKVLSGTDAVRVLLDESLDVVGQDVAEAKLYEALDLVAKMQQLLKSNGVEVPGL
jgi:hypothetical protein